MLYPASFSLDKVSEKRRKDYFLIWYREFVYASYCIPDAGDFEWLFLRSLVRDDYKVLFEDVVNCLTSDDVCVVSDYVVKSDRVNIDAVKFIERCRPLLSLFSTLPVYKRLCLFIRLCNYLFVLEKVKNIKFRKLVLFADMQPVDNLLAQYYKGKVKTVTMQHGLYVDYGDEKTVNVINYLHHEADYFLAWGEDTKALIKKYHPKTQVVICGKPKISVADKSESYSEIKSAYFMVILDQSTYDDANIDMLRISYSYAESVGIGVRVKFHPSNVKHKFYKIFPCIIEGAEIWDAEFVIGHTSSLIYEAMVFGKRVYKYQTAAPALRTPEEICFANLAELIEVICKDIDFMRISKNYISYCGDESRKRYTNFFDSL